MRVGPLEIIGKNTTTKLTIIEQPICDCKTLRYPHPCLSATRFDEQASNQTSKYDVDEQGARVESLGGDKAQRDNLVVMIEGQVSDFGHTQSRVDGS
jgi:hypothetical protein